jgi:hypothetical protein
MDAAHHRPPVPGLPWVSLYIGHPANIYVCNNTFIKFHDGDTNYIGLITNLNASNSTMEVRKFLTWQQLLQMVPQVQVEAESFWPYGSRPHVYLCDTDFIIEIGACNVVSIAFVFYESDNLLRELQGVKDVYCVSSCFNHQNLILCHRCSFSAFPSLWAEDLGVYLPSCFPSMIMRELHLIKNKVQITLNTRSKKQ